MSSRYDPSYTGGNQTNPNVLPRHHVPQMQPATGFVVQTGQQVPTMRGLSPAPTPPPPTQDIQSMTHPSISLNSCYQRQGQPVTIRHSAPPNQQQNQRGSRGQSPVIQQQFSALPPNYVMQNYQLPQNYNATARQGPAHIFSQANQTFQPATIQSPYQYHQYYYTNPQVLQQSQRPGASQVLVQQPSPATQQTTIAMTQETFPTINQSMSPGPQQNLMNEPRKRRTHAISIVDPKSGKDVLEEILSGDTTTTTTVVESKPILIEQPEEVVVVTPAPIVVVKDEPVEPVEVPIEPVEIPVEPIEVPVEITTPVVSVISGLITDEILPVVETIEQIVEPIVEQIVEPVIENSVADEEISEPITSEVEEISESDETDKAIVNEPQIEKLNLSETKPVEEVIETKDETTTTVDETEVVEAIPAKLIDYDDGQWSPSNPDGKKYYTKDQLMKLKENPNSLTKPDNIHDSDILLKTIRTATTGQNSENWKNTKQSSNSGGANFLMPNFARNSQNLNRGGSVQGGNQNYQKRSSQTGGQNNNKNSSKSNQMIHVRISLKEDVKLNETENAWKPTGQSTGQTNSDLPDDERATADLYKKVRSILNKLTPEKFDQLVSQLKNCKIDTSARLLGVIELIFEKAVDEPNFSVAYAKLCLALCPTTVEDAVTKETLMFKKKLLVHCQAEFERISADETGDIRLKNIENCSDPEKRAELEEEDRKYRKRSVGTVRFIGELFKIEILTPKIMHTCIQLLLKQNEHEESLECICKLLTTVGQPMESRKEDIEKYITQIRQIVDHKSNKVSSRVRFMLQDVIDLRRNNWIPRRNDNNPKTISQIQKEADNELLQQQIMNYQLPSRKEDNNRRNDNRDNNRGFNNKHGNNNRQGGVSEDGWSTTPSKNRPSTFDPQKFNVKALNVDSNTQLGQASQFKWNTSKIETPISGNKFDALASLDSRSDSRSGGSFMPPREQSYDGRRSQRGSQQQRSRDNSGSRMKSSGSRSLHQMPKQQQNYMGSISQKGLNDKPIKQQQQVVEPELNEKQIEQVHNSLCTIVEEFLSGQAKEEFTDELKKMVTGSVRKMAVTHLFNVMLEKSKKHRLATGEIIVHMFNNQIIRMEDYVNGLSEVLEFVEDISIDIPKIWDYLAELLTPAIIEKIITFEILLKVGGDLIRKGGYGKKYLASVLKFIEAEYGPKVVRDLWGEQSFKNFMDEKEVEEFEKINKLSYLTTGSGELPQATKPADLNRIEVRTKEFLTKAANFDVITSWIDANAAIDSPDKQYIRSLSNAVFEFCIKPFKSSYKLDQEALERYAPLLSRYIDNKENSELQCLYSLQNVIHRFEHPQGILRSIVNSLYEQDVISSEGFMKWRDCKNVLEQEGKGVAVTSLVSFFTGLQEQGETSGDDAA